MESPVEQKNENALKPKQKYEGKVLKTSLQGALIDISNPLPAFLHISQVINQAKPEEIVKNLEEVIKVGDPITVWVKRVLKDHIELTMKEPLALEWREIVPDMVLKGKVARLESFGAFIELGAERPGLVHVSELSHNYVKLPSEVVKVGDEVEVKVLEIDKRKKQIKLSMKALQEEPEIQVEEKRPPRKGGKPAKKEVVQLVEEEIIPDPTFMEIALRQAMDRAEKRKPQPQGRLKKTYSVDSETEDIFERTMRSKQSRD
ncbi:MAG: S1 RNA-binding domain-containing protein [Anaerolineaceae bacterium]|nr:S1 RNA-binding domain-containing protein [Anaerolineaceae bacterium]